MAARPNEVIFILARLLLYECGTAWVTVERCSCAR